MKAFYFTAAFLLSCIFSIAQPFEAARDWWNVLRYDVELTPDFSEKTITGINNIQLWAIVPGKKLQIDMLPPMRITGVTWQQRPLTCSYTSGAWMVTLPETLRAGQTVTLAVRFTGKPQGSVAPPYDGGWIWAKDSLGRPWMTIACEGTGAAIWLPCKNVLRDEPDSGASLAITVPDSLVAVGNGRLRKKVIHKNGTATWYWAMKYPVNNYNLIPYIGKYVTWHHTYNGIKGKLDCDYWVLDYNKEKAQKQFLQVDTMLRCFEDWLGAYPFYEDSYKLVEAPHAGMEHQSAIAYGNGFMNGFRGKDLSGSGWGLKWDFILVHESGHEWFGNNITAYTDGDSWLHEGFTKYLETLYTTWLYGTEAGNDYAIGIRKRIKNDEPIIGTNTSDKYNKGSALLHMVRHIAGDSVFRILMHRLNSQFHLQMVTTKQVTEVVNTVTAIDFTRTFAQYLTTTQVPVLEYAIKGNQLEYRWAGCVAGFNMPVKITDGHKGRRLIYPTTQWQQIQLFTGEYNGDSISVDRNFYVTIRKALR